MESISVPALYACRKVSTLTAFFPLWCVMSLKMTCWIHRPSGTMLYPCKKGVGVDSNGAELQLKNELSEYGEVVDVWVSFLSMILYSVEVFTGLC